jgi:hypothetical protein
VRIEIGKPQNKETLMNLRSILQRVAGCFHSNQNKASRPPVRRTSLTLESLEGRDAPTGLSFNQAFALAAYEMTHRASTPSYAQHSSYTPTYTQHQSYTPQYQSYTPSYNPYQSYTPSYGGVLGRMASEYSVPYGLNQTGLGENGNVTSYNQMMWNPYASTTPAMAASGFTSINPFSSNPFGRG